ncbi:MAG TPA: hypothetical protein VG328_02435 [Stellaceae bacterium]|jgi:hypothetical protein|nr:hypothetical protein [Stellaceae bacterium]
MNDETSSGIGPATYHIMLRVRDGVDFRRAGSVRLATQPPRGTVIEVECEGCWLRGIVEAIFIPPGCEENCIGTVFLAEAEELG